jgi:uncharacterized protein (TIGR02001 family)
MMRKILLGGALAAALATPVFAQDAPAITGNIALTTDYTFRGVSQTDESPAVQGGFDYAGPNTFYAGTWASNVNFGTGGSNMELDLYAGFKPVLNGITFDLGVIGYLYPGASDDGAEFDYWEIYAKPSFSPAEGVTLGGALYYSPEFTGESGDGFYYEVNGAFAATPTLTLSGAVGQQTVDLSGFFAGEDSYTTWNAGGTLSAMGLGFDLRYVGTDVDGPSIYDDRVVFSIKRAM